MRHPCRRRQRRSLAARNIENSSYILATCAQRLALFKAEGATSLDSSAISSSGIKVNSTFSYEDLFDKMPKI